MNKEEIFKSLVENGLDFLSEAISALKDKPKYSVIHFYAAVELFVKARIMHEHWSLVIAKRQDPDWKNFIEGNFQSVSLEEAARRLEKIVRSGLSVEELEAFQNVAKHRNKAVHFFHKDYTEKESEEFKHSIIKEQLKAWYFLHQLLTDKWSKEFSSWNEEIANIDSDLRKIQEFLQVVFDKLQPKIEELKKTGTYFDECPSCGFESKKHVETENTIYESKCLVCKLVEKCLKIKCPKCREVVIFKGEGFSRCQSCSEELEPEHVVNVLIDSDACFDIAVCDDDHPWGAGNCGGCEGHHTVVCTRKDELICVSCFEAFESFEFCGWCNEPNTGDMEHSYIVGCHSGHCDGRPIV